MSETLLNEIRAARPEAPAALRERVRALSVQEPVREPFSDRMRFNWGWRRLVLVAPSAVAVALVAGSVIGLTRGDVGGRESEQAASAPPAAATSDSLRVAPALPETSLAAPSAKDAAGGAGSAVTPVPGQLQRFEAELSLRVDD